MKAHTNKAFTMVELLIAMGLVAILVALSSVVFAAAVRAHRTADSTIEISRRVEAIGQQLNSDVRGLRTDAPLAIWFERDAATGTRYDQIQFFANGNFQTINVYSPSDDTVRGNLSRVYYGHAWSGNVNSDGEPWTWEIRDDGGYRWVSQADPGAQLLSRRAHLLTSNTALLPVNPFPNQNDFIPSDSGDYANGPFVPYWNNRLEYDQLSLAEWMNLMADPANCTQMLWGSFAKGQSDNNYSETGRPIIDMTNADTLHLLLSEHVSEFRVQWAYTVEDLSVSATEYIPVPEIFQGVLWFPAASDFAEDEFGAYFNMPAAGHSLWHGVQSGSQRCRAYGGYYFRQDFFPRALKFTFTLHDAKGLFPDGKTFTQVVYINQ